MKFLDWLVGMALVFQMWMLSLLYVFAVVPAAAVIVLLGLDRYGEGGV